LIWLIAALFSTSCMRGNSSAGNLTPLDLEIEATCRRNNAEKRRKILQERTAQPSSVEVQSSSAFPELRDFEVGASEAHIMVEDQPRRLTLEDYSSSIMP